MRSMSDWKEDRAREGASALASQLVSSRVGINFGSDEPAERKIATETQIRINSTGMIGLDPWGKPYNYAVIRDEQNKRIAIVLSNGPNQKRETYEEHLVFDSSKALFVNVNVQGDDIHQVVRKSFGGSTGK